MTSVTEPNTIKRRSANAERNEGKQTKLPYNPRLSEQFSEDFYAAAYAAYEAGFPINAGSLTRQLQTFELAVQKARTARATAKQDGEKETSDKLAFNIAALLLLRDLVQMGWTLDIQGTNIQLQQQSLSNDREIAKQQIRASMGFERRESLSGSSVKDFVRDMEKPRFVDGDERSIFSLIADGPCLHKALASVMALPEHEREDILQTHVRPYLQLVEGEQRDEFTSLRLIDIWRYFRLTWSTPYRHTPGRNVFYLVRDAAQPCHPVIGIAALSNCIIGIRCRDDKIGWTPDAIAARLKAAKEQDEKLKKTGSSITMDNLRKIVWETAEMLKTHLENGLAAIATEGITTRNEVAYPTEEGIAEIWRKAEDATQERYLHLQEEAIAATLAPDEFELQLTDAPKAHINREARESSTALFRRKRASKLAALLQAKLLCQQKNAFDNPVVGLPALFWTDRELQTKYEAGRSAIRTILNANKDTKIGSSMMEITVCGAVAPYNTLLGGKLVAMLLVSPQVVRDYALRYGDQASTIASQVAGHDVKREAHLAFLGTSSLYADAGDKKKHQNEKNGISDKRPRYSSASQYNRVRVPASIVESPGEIRYDCLGMTEGYGVVHFAADTREALEELDIITHQAKRVNSLFGEGMSPRLRKIRQGISLLGLSDDFLVHGQKRLVYGIDLAHNTDNYLQGLEPAPNYILPLSDVPEKSSEKISQYWIKRWLIMRINEPNVMQKIADFDPRSFAVSHEYGGDFPTIPTDLGL